MSGRIISSRSFTYTKSGAESSGLSIKMSVNTGQKAKDGEYPPSFIIDVPLWDKLATISEPKAVAGTYAIVSGKLAAPTVYTSSDGEKSGVNMAFHYVDDIQFFTAPVKGDYTGDTGGTKTVTETKSDKKRRAAVEEVEEDDIPF